MSFKIKKIFYARSRILLNFASVLVVFTFMSCDNHPHFNNSTEAIEACHKFLLKYRDMKDASTKDLAENISDWLELQDSAYSAFSRDSSVTLHSPIALAYFTTADSVRIELKRIAMARPRTLKDVMYLKIYTAKEREKVRESAEWKATVKFYKALDERNCYPNLPVTLSAYNELFRNAKDIKKGKQLRDFIVEEDRCFRSLMRYLSAVPQNRLKDLTAKTSLVFDKFYNAVGIQHRQVDEQTMILLIMRFNRRIIENAEACRADINNNFKLDEAQRANYRWMLIQPYLTLDSFSSAALTDKQIDSLLDIAEDLPGLLNALDDKETNNNKAQEVTKVLGNYFLNSYIQSTL